MSIKWLVTPVINKQYWEYNLKDTKWTEESPHPHKSLEQEFIRIPSQNHKDQALLLLSLGMSKDEIEEILNATHISN